MYFYNVIGLSAKLNKYTLRDPNSYHLHQALNSSNTNSCSTTKGTYLFPRIRLTNSMGDREVKEPTDVPLLQSALNAFKSQLLTNHFYFPSTSSFQQHSYSQRESTKLPIEPSFAALKSINFPFQKLGICLNQVFFHVVSI